MATDSAPTQPNGLDFFAADIRAALAAALDLPADDFQLERPRNEAHGEFAFPCFRYAKGAGCSPPELAAKLAADLDIADVTASSVGPFLNFQVEPKRLAVVVMESALKPNFASDQQGLTTIVEFSSPNIAKPMHVGHMRTTVIGAALARIFAHLGHDVVRINHIGDWGSQFGKLVAAWKRWGDEDRLQADPIAELLQLYVRYHEEEEEDESLPVEAKAAFQELESGDDNETRKTWEHFTELSMREFNHVYDRFGIQFDFIRGESWYEDKLDPLSDWLDSCGVTEQSDGATIVDLTNEGIKTPCLVKTAHGTTLYATRDLAAAKSRWEEFEFDQLLYVVGAEQTLHFQQFKAVLKRCGAEWQQRMEHVPFGLIRLAEGKLSTRAGRVIGLAEVLDRAVELARAAVDEKNPELQGKAEVAEMVGVGAVVFHDLKHQRQKDVVFDWKEVLSFEGDTGPYLQYTHARCCSILRKAERPVASVADIDPALFDGGHELFVAIGRLPQALRESGQKREPMLLAHALLKIASAGNVYYRENRVLGTGDPALEDARLAVIQALRNTLALGLELLGVPVPEQM
ncbi:MAG: arginine--tRNA ligase [Planctomycetota bacterium]|jgi:arginyl-tRNA synthetase|nr:arginine--tRNA ligase [Planctomycetota bacterium]